MRYTKEQKADAVNSMNEIGVAKTKEKMGIGLQTLYKWKREADGTAKHAPASKAGKVKAGRKSKKATSAPATEESKPTEQVAAPNADDIRALLAKDTEAEQKIAALQSEIITLREKNARLRKALASFID